MNEIEGNQQLNNDGGVVWCGVLLFVPRTIIVVTRFLFRKKRHYTFWTVSQYIGKARTAANKSHKKKSSQNDCGATYYKTIENKNSPETRRSAAGSSIRTSLPMIP
jgi:hypothetical protein